MKPRWLGVSLLLLLLGDLFLGMARLALLPPWEGFDEPAHYSYLQQIADTDALPRPDTARMGVDYEDYAKAGPLAYTSVPPFLSSTSKSYVDYFRDAPSGPGIGHVRPATPRRFVPGRAPNWHAHWAPLYYVLLGPVYHCTSGLSWNAHLTVLRLLSFIFAWMALAATVWALLAGHGSLSPEQGRLRIWAAWGVAAWPLCFPSWFPQNARLGNISLCSLLAALIFALSVLSAGTRLTTARSVVLGLLLGLGGLVKPFFVPVALSLAFFLFFLGRRGENGGGFWRPMARPALMLGVAAIVSGWWYAGNQIRFGVWSGFSELSAFQQAGGWVAGWREFSWGRWVWGMAVFVATLGWCGTRSLVLAPAWAYAAPAFLAFWITGAYAAAIAPRGRKPWTWLPVWMGAPLLASCVYVISVRAALPGHGTALNGAYLHLMAGPLGAAAGVAIARADGHKAFGLVTGLLLVCSLIFFAALFWAQTLLFAGVLVKSPDKLYAFAENLPACAEVFSRLSSVAWPVTGTALWVLGMTLWGWGLALAFKAGVKAPSVKSSC